MIDFKSFSNDLSDAYKEILVLDQKLTEEGISHKLSRKLDGWKIIVYDEQEKPHFMILETRASYGHTVDRLEMGLSNGISFIGYPEGCLSAESVLQKIKENKEKRVW